MNDNRIDLIQLLIQNGASVYVFDDNDDSPLYDLMSEIKLGSGQIPYYPRKN